MVLYIWQYSSEVFSKIGVIDNAKSLIWVKRYDIAGEFELYIRASEDLLALFRQDNLFLGRDDRNEIMSVEKVRLVTNFETGNYLIISGRTAECLLGRRIITSQAVFNSQTPETIARTLIVNNIIAPSDNRRIIRGISLGDIKHLGQEIDRQFTGTDVLTAISSLSASVRIGFELRFTGTTLLFEMYKGLDRTYSQNVNGRVIFSPNFETLGDTEYMLDKTTLYNSAYVAGEGEGKNRVIVNAQIPIQKTGMELRELWIDSRNTSRNNGEISQADYGLMLYNQGSERLSQTTETTTFSGTILDSGLYQYGTDYGLGDIVQIENEYGITGTATVTAITEVEDETGYRIYPTLSDWSV